MGLPARMQLPPTRAADRRAAASDDHSVIASLDGVVGAVSADSLVLEVGGVGYRVFAAPSLLAAATPGSRMKVHTHHLVREDLQALYGFRTPEELGFFGLLLTVTGVGPKVALAILGSRQVADLQLAIMADDQAVLTSVSGVGKRLAARIVLELREKVAAAGLAAGSGSVGVPGIPGRVPESDVVAALQALGYTLAEARDGARVALVVGGASLEDRVKAALRAMSSG
jgi:holliday junction DNA helicase RuvA